MPWKNEDKFENLPRYDAPGRFEGELALVQYLYELTLIQGHDDEIGSVVENGAWYALFEKPVGSDYEGEYKLSDLEKEFLSEHGAILVEDDRGFVSATFYHDEEKLMKDWNEIVAELSESDGEEEDSEDED